MSSIALTSLRFGDVVYRHFNIDDLVAFEPQSFATTGFVVVNDNDNRLVLRSMACEVREIDIQSLVNDSSGNQKDFLFFETQIEAINAEIKRFDFKKSPAWLKWKIDFLKRMIGSILYSIHLQDQSQVSG
jgi:hypothetical protein